MSVMCEECKCTLYIEDKPDGTRDYGGCENGCTCCNDEEIITLEHTTLFFKKMHSTQTCEGQPCTIHNRTNHSMRKFPQHWRGDRAIMERICEHGIGHPDPDEYKLALYPHEATHGCDGCCYSGGDWHETDQK